MKVENRPGVWSGWLGSRADRGEHVWGGRILLWSLIALICSGLAGVPVMSGPSKNEQAGGLREVLVSALCGVSVAAAQTYRLPDTGINKCYDGVGNEITCPQPGQPFYGQDAQYRGPQPSFRDNGDGTVSDLNTGLMWQKGDSQNDNRSYDWQQATDYCASLSLAGHGDWRLPSVDDLSSIVDYGKVDPAIDTRFFPECRSNYYWSSSTYAASPNDAWYVDFSNGYVHWDNKTYSSLLVRCVRGGL